MSATATIIEPKRSTKRDRRVVFWVLGAMLLVILLYSVFGPRQDDDNPEPTTYNSSTRGVRAAYLLLAELGFETRRWESPAAQLKQVDAARTTLIFTAPKLPAKDLKPLQAAIQEFLDRGGRVLATGPSGALLLPGGKTGGPTNAFDSLCFTTPEGTGALARAGEVTTSETVRWTAVGPQYHVEQRCGADAVVVRYKVGKGEAIWWSSPMPLTNAGLSDDASLRLVLASIGPAGRTVLFDEYLHAWRETIVDTVRALPWWALGLQSLAVALLLVASRSRRNGPLRMPVSLPRTSPIEFAESMGHLYAKAGATQAATEAARRRLTDFLREHCGIPRELLRVASPSLGPTLTERFGGDWTELDQHLEQAGIASANALAPKSALKLVQSLDRDYVRLQQLTRSRKAVVIQR